MTASLTVDNIGTPPASESRTLLDSVALAVNDHAASIDTLNANIGGTLTADAPGRAKIAAGFFDAATIDSAFATGAIGQELLEPELDATALANAVDGAVSPTSLQPAIGAYFSLQHADHATETLIYKTTRKIQIIGVTILKSGANVAGTTQVTDATDAAITDAIAADTDKAVTRQATIDPAKSTIAAGGTFKVVYTRAGVSSLQQVLVHVLLRA
jgi:hypothetical protein